MTLSPSIRAMLVLCICILSSPTPARAQKITVGKNVQISKDEPNLPHNELLAAAHPTDPKKMVACSQAYRSDSAWATSIIYFSNDGGNSWRKSWEKGNNKKDLRGYGDPVCTFGNGDTTLFVLLGHDPSSTEVYRSHDDGRTWPDSVMFGFIDREYAAVDRTGGKYNGRIYVGGTGDVRGENMPLSAFSLYRSLDGGKTFLGPASWAPATPRYILAPGTGIVMSDGTVAFAVPVMRNYSMTDPEGFENKLDFPNAALYLYTSTDGGGTVKEGPRIADMYMDAYPWKPINTDITPALAVDSRPPFKDRIYAVWTDKRAGRQREPGPARIMFAYSPDAGKTWVAPRVITDDPTDREITWDNLHPTIQVNKNGVVGVAWYDRRGSKNNLDWVIRFVASMDGGDTWSPSVVVSDRPTDFDRAKWVVRSWGNGLHINSYDFMGGDTDEMMVDANGVFRPVWIDNRTGVPQMWTTAVTVDGTVTRNGDPSLADLDDLGKQLTIQYTGMTYDRKTNELSALMRLKNISTDTIRGPVKLRLLSIESELGLPVVSGADNGNSGTGAMFDFTSLIPASGLVKDSVTAGKRIVIRLTQPRSVWQAGQVRTNLANPQFKILGRTSKKEI
jgi:hypothetical protein